jgi:hypothetical protein
MRLMARVVLARMRTGACTAALSCAAVLGAGCGTGPATPSPAPAVSGARPPPGGVIAPSQRRVLAARYLAIALPANRRLEVAFTRLERRDGGRLAAARADLRAAAATERMFDRQLLRIAFPPALAAVARLLYRANQARARLTGAAAALPGLAGLHRAERALHAANRPVEDAVTVLRSQLGLPPPPAS